MSNEDKNTNEYIKKRVKGRVRALVEGADTELVLTNRLKGLKQKRMLFIESRENGVLLKRKGNLGKRQIKDGDIF